MSDEMEQESAADLLALLTDEDRDILIDALKGWREDGVEDPRIAIDVDLDGDGMVDAYALDEDDHLIVVRNVDLANTVYQADGEEGGD